VLRTTFGFLSGSATARRISMNVPGARNMARRFVAGDTVADGIAAARELAGRGFGVSLDYLGESVRSREAATAAADTYIAVIDRIGRDPALRERVNVSLKLTQMGQDIPLAGGGANGREGDGAGGSAGGRADGPTAMHEQAGSRWPHPPHGMTPLDDGGHDDAFLRANVVRILDAARDHDIFVRFDMEGTPHTQRTLDFFHSLRDAGYTNTGIVLQAYLLRSLHDARYANRLGCRVRLCKGAYREPARYAFQARKDVSASFVQVMQILLSDGNYPGIATHDEALIDATREYAAAHDLPSAGWEFQMLYGVRRDLQTQLLAGGYNLRVYVPFGEAWYPYLMRRLAERPANALFILSAVLRESPLRFLLRSRRR
jgi:proline dehydrogenase